jgi:hypothetical protein
MARLTFCQTMDYYCMARLAAAEAVRVHAKPEAWQCRLGPRRDRQQASQRFQSAHIILVCLLAEAALTQQAKRTKLNALLRPDLACFFLGALGSCGTWRTGGGGAGSSGQIPLGNPYIRFPIRLACDFFPLPFHFRFLAILLFRFESDRTFSYLFA